MKKITIAGASGFVGSFLSRVMLAAGHEVTGIGTSGSHPFESEYETFRWISADTTVPGNWQDRLKASEIIVNLTGRSIFKYWTQTQKQAIYDSRIRTTRHIVEALEYGAPKLLVNASAVGIYGDRGDALLDEQTAPGSGFLAEVCVDWEKEAARAAEKGVDVAIMRFGVVLGEGGGALEKMVPAFKLFVGGPLGSGKHWFPWIHIKDLSRAAMQIIDGKIDPGVYNFTGAEPIRQEDFAKTLGNVLGRPSIMPAPAFMIRLIMGELGASLLHSQRAVPEALLDQGFVFEFPDVASALTDILVK